MEVTFISPNEATIKIFENGGLVWDFRVSRPGGNVRRGLRKIAEFDEHRSRMDEPLPRLSKSTFNEAREMAIRAIEDQRASLEMKVIEINNLNINFDEREVLVCVSWREGEKTNKLVFGMGRDNALFIKHNSGAFLPDAHLRVICAHVQPDVNDAFADHRMSGRQVQRAVDQPEFML